MKRVLRRVLFYVVTGWVALTVNFFLPRLMPGDPAMAMFARFRGKLDPAALDALRETFGLTDEPLWSQYWSYLGHLLQGDLGISVAYFPSSVGSVVGVGMLWSLFLVGTALVISFVLGTGLGAYNAWRREGRVDAITSPWLVFVGAFPFFWLGMVLLYVFGYELGWFPVRHAYGYGVSPGFDASFFTSALRHAALPGLTIVLATMGGWMLSMRNNMTSILGADYIRLARAKGLSEGRILRRYAARNAFLPSLTGFGMAFGMVLSGSLLTEIVFAYPGQGYLLVQAVRNQDFPLLQGLFLSIVVAVLLANALVDVAYVSLDPRVRGETS